MTSDRVTYLNFLRSISGIIVLVSHYFQIFELPVRGRPVWINFFLQSSHYAVLFFFILSGFLISVSIENNITRNRCNFSPKEFILKRFARLYPTLIYSIVITFLIYCLIKYMGLHGSVTYVLPSDIHPPTRDFFDFSVKDAFHTLIQIYAFAPGTYLTANGPLWSLSYEIGFYIIACCTSLIMFKNKAPYSKITAATILLLILYSAITNDKLLFFYFFNIWLFGLIAFKISKSKNQNYLLCAIPLIVANSFLFLSLKSFILDSLFCCFSIFAINARFYDKLAMFSIVRKIATYSTSTYTLYLLHFPIMLLIFSLTHPLSANRPFVYSLISSLLTLIVFFLCHFLARYTEDTNYYYRFAKKYFK